jgi:Raf kinase inhibitor-like YbhB/YbcL family protein
MGRTLEKKSSVSQGVGMRLTPLFLLIAGALILTAQQPARSGRGAPPRPSMVVSSPGFNDGAELPKKFSCTAQADAVSPQIDWKNTPPGTQSFALLLHDPEPHHDKSRYDVTHWIIWNIPGTASGLPENVPARVDLPDGSRQGKNTRGQAGYFGPCAPAGPGHHYTYEVFALDSRLDLSPEATRDDFEKAIDGHVLGAGEIVVLFHQ